MNAYYFDIHMRLDAQSLSVDDIDHCVALNELDDIINEMEKFVDVTDSSMEKDGWGRWRAIVHVAIQADKFISAWHLANDSVRGLTITEITEV